jgi:hypothetical protein
MTVCPHEGAAIVALLSMPSLRTGNYCPDYIWVIFVLVVANCHPRSKAISGYALIELGAKHHYAICVPYKGSGF